MNAEVDIEMMSRHKTIKTAAAHNIKAGRGKRTMTDIKIYNGNQIGGCVTVISSYKGKVMIDFGTNLPGAQTDK